MRGVDNLLHYGRKTTPEIKGYLDFRDWGYAFNLLPTDDNTLIIAKEEIIKNKRNLKSGSIYSGYLRESFIKDNLSRNSLNLGDQLPSFRVYHFQDTSISCSLRLKRV